MKRSSRIAAQLAWMAFAFSAFAQEEKPARQESPAAPRGSSEPLTAWQWYQDVRLPDWKEAPRWIDFVLTTGVFDRSQVDLADLRLYDAKNREVPYALRIRRPRDEQVQLSSREFNRAAAPDRSAELSLDLGEAPDEHNEINLNTNNINVRRRLQLEGSSDGKTWSSMKLDKEFLVHFQVDSQVVDVSRFRYTPSRFRYLRVHVSPDPGLTDDKPEITSVGVFRTIRVAGEDITLPASLGERQPERGDGGPGSAWIIDLGEGSSVASPKALPRHGPPCQRLNFEISDSEFSRPYRLEIPGTEDEEAMIHTNQTVANGVWERRLGEKPRPLVIELSPEVTVRRLRLVVTDHRNPPLDIKSVNFTAPVRQVIFAPTPDLTPPLRLYFGQPTAQRPQYDFEALLPANLEPAPQRGTLQPTQANPVYQPPPLPLTERWPWLVYVVLGAASLVLLGILVALGRETIARHDKLAASQV